MGIVASMRLLGFGFLMGLSAIGLAGCVGGTTYGTGGSQEEQTMKDVYNMFTLRPERRNIDYSPRPDLVVPANRASLPEPLDSEASTSAAQWPETPEQRIARIRAQAGEVDPRTGDVSVEERLRRKEGIAIERGYAKNDFVPGVTDRDGNPILYNGQKSQADRAAVLKRKQELSMSVGANRKFLTEPPVEYRVPASSAPSGVDAYTEEEKTARAEAEREAKLKRMQDMGGRR